jgi:hypothetical protein
LAGFAIIKHAVVRFRDASHAKEACAEFLTDVGHEWDAVIAVYGNPPSRVPKDIKELIERLYESHPRSPFDHRKPPPPDWLRSR